MGVSEADAHATLQGQTVALQQALVDELRAKIAEQQKDLKGLRATLEGLEGERDFYFRKLRNVEKLCTALQDKMDPDLTIEKLVVDVQGILYAEGDGDGDTEGLDVAVGAVGNGNGAAEDLDPVVGTEGNRVAGTEELDPAVRFEGDGDGAAEEPDPAVGAAESEGVGATKELDPAVRAKGDMEVLTEELVAGVGPPLV